MSSKRAVFWPKTGNSLPVLDKIFFEMSSKMVKMIGFKIVLVPKRKKAPLIQGASAMRFERKNRTVHMKTAGLNIRLHLLPNSYSSFPSGGTPTARK